MAKAGVPVSATNPSQHQPLDSTNLIKGSAPQSDLTGPTAPVAGATEERRSPASGTATGKPEQQGSNGAVGMPASDESTADTIKEDKRSESTPAGGGPPASETTEETGDKKSPLNGGGSGGSPGAASATAGTPPAVTASQAASSGNNSNSSNVNNSNSSNSTSNKNDHKERDEKGDPLARNGANNNNGSSGGLNNATADASLETLGDRKSVV